MAAVPRARAQPVSQPRHRVCRTHTLWIEHVPPEAQGWVYARAHCVPGVQIGDAPGRALGSDPSDSAPIPKCRRWPSRRPSTSHNCSPAPREAQASRVKEPWGFGRGAHGRARLPARA